MAANDNEMAEGHLIVENNVDTDFRTSEYGFREKMFKYFQDGDFCDVTLEAGKDKKKYSIHRVVLSAASDYFSALFTNEMKEKYQTEILLEDIDGVTLLNLIEYCYRGEIGSTEDNIDGLLAAHMLRLTQLVQKCIDYYKHALSSTNCLGICALAKQYDFDTVMNLASSFAFENFMDVVNSDEFKYMEVELLSEFLSSDNVNVDSEEDVFNALVIWMEFDLTKRLSHLENLIETIRVGLLPKSVLETTLLLWCQQINNFQLYGNLLNRHSTGQASARKSTAFGRLFAIGGSDLDEENDCLSVERYCDHTNTWTRFHDIPSYRYAFSSVHFSNQFIIIGGCDISEAETATVLCLDLKTLTTKVLQPMIVERSHHVAAYVDGFIYAIGGRNSNRLISSVECYDKNSNHWTEVAPLTKKRRHAASAVLSGTIFVIGGRDIWEALNSVECYVPGVNMWVPVSAMIERRSTAQAGVANNILYVYGGWNDNSSVLNTLEKYDAKENTWTLLTFRLKIPRFDFGCAILNDWLFVMGGQISPGNTTNLTEKIDLTTGESIMLAPMVCERALFSAAYLPSIDFDTA